MSGSSHYAEINRRRHRKHKRTKLRAQLGGATATGRAAIEAKLLKTYPLGLPQAPKAKAPKAEAPAAQ